jgi:hypothetical protein
VVEAVFGYNSNVVAFDPNFPGLGYGVGAKRTVMLRWPATQPDPEVKVGSWIADVTYERHLVTAASRFAYAPSSAQRCIWYQVSKVQPPANVPPGDPALDFGGAGGTPYRYMMVITGSDLQAKTVLNVNNGHPAVVNAALVSPHVVNVFPRTFVISK